MKKLFYLGLLLLGAISCTVNDEAPKTTEGIKALDLSTSTPTVKYYFGPESTNTGSIEVSVSEDGTILTVLFQAPEGQKITNSRLDIVGDPSEFETNGGGNLPPGKMNDYKKLGTPDTRDIYEIPMSNFSENDCIYIAPWAIFTGPGSHQHYAGNILGGNVHHELWWYFQFGDCTTTVQENCDSAYMYDANNILKLNSWYKEKPSATPTANNWGWYQDYTGGLGSTATYPLWAGAGNNDITKLTAAQVGTVTVTVSNTGEISVVPDFWYAAISYDFHVFIAENLPAKRPVPGKFETLSTGDTNGDGKFKIIVHAKACWNQ